MSLIATDSPATLVLPGVDDPVRRITAAWLAAQRSAHTRRAYLRALRHWHDWCAVTSTDPILPDRADAAVWIAWQVDEGAAPASVRQRVAAVAGWLDELALARLRADVRPFAGQRLPRRAQPVLEHLTTEDVRSLVDGGDALGGPGATAVRVLATMGLRAGECGQAAAGAVRTLAGRTLLRVDGKGGKLVDVPVHAAVLPSAGRYGWPGDSLPAGWADRDLELPADRVRGWLADAARRSGLRTCTGRVPTPHMVRHWFVTTALGADVPLHVVQDAARHADPATTRRYDDQRGALVNMERVSETVGRVLGL